MPRIILASASPRRQELLSYLGVNFDVMPADIDETPREGEEARKYVVRLAQEKAHKIHQQNPGSIVIGADTTLQVGSYILGKAESAEEAEKMLRLKSGRATDVLTGVAVIDANGTMRSALSASWVQVKELSDDEIAKFIADEKNWRGCSGAMRTEQNYGASFYPEMQGSITGIIGLPLHETVTLLRESGLVL